MRPSEAEEVPAATSRAAPPTARRMFGAAAAAFPGHAPRLLALLAGWVGTWVVLELLVVSISPTPLRPLWLLFHLAYFLATSFWEVAMTRVAIDAHGAGEARIIPALLDGRLALRMLGLKAILAPAVLAGLALGVVPGLYLLARFGLAPFFLVARKSRVRTALKLSDRAGCGHRPRLLKLFALLLLANLLGAALLGVGLLGSVPLTLLATGFLMRSVGD